MIAKSWLGRCWQWQIGGCVAIFGALSGGVSDRVNAQIVPDNTLGAEGSVVTPNVFIRGIQGDRIDGGATRGANLFHSFQEFNVGEGRGAYFANPTGIENILTRVTGGNPSNIFGRLGVLGEANLFLLNPNGILFGQNASLDIQGSFVATTAQGIGLGKDGYFSATQPQSSSLLSVSPGVLFLNAVAASGGSITNAGNLAVGKGETLTLAGSTVTSTGSLTAPGGVVQVLGERVGLLENARIDVSSDTGGGTVLIGGGFQGKGEVPNAARTFVGPSVTINANANQSGKGGNVIVWADEVTGFYGNISARGGSDAGNGGFVEVSGKQHLIFRGTVDTSAANGLSGTLLLDPTDIVIATGSGDSAADGTDTFAGNNSGVAGAILSAPLSQIDDTAPTTIYESELEGLSGDTKVILQATNDIRIEDLADDALKFAPGSGVIGLTADADSDGVGSVVMEDTIGDTLYTNGRDIVINGASLTLGNINTSSINAGAITLIANGDITTNGKLISSSESGNGGAISLSSSSGNITTNSRLDSSSYSESGNAGNGGAISLSSSSGDITTNDWLGASSLSSFDGNAGNGGVISLSSSSGNITTNSELDSSSYSPFGNAGNGGEISLSSNSGDITTNSKFDSFSFSRNGNAGNGGEIFLIARGGDIIPKALPQPGH
jgi:filamentous hemagglutinin family protein